MLAGAALLALSTALAAPDRPLLVFYGNVVLNDEVYRAVVDLPAGVRATPIAARLVRRRVLEFLHKAGYELATAEAHVEDDQIVVGIEEGRLDKVIILGEGAFQTLRLKLALSIPANVYNRPLIERQLAAVQREYGLDEVRWELAPVRDVEHVGPQLESVENVPALETMPLITPGRPYELRIYVENYTWDIGFAPELRFNSLEGVGAGMRWRTRDLLLENDRFETRGRLAGTLRGSIDDDSTNLVLSRALAEALWYTPSFVGDGLRSFVWLRADLLNRKREDLGLQSFFSLPLEVSLNLELRLIKQASLSAGAGLQHRFTFGIDRATTVPVDPVVDRAPNSETRPFFISLLDLTFNLDEIRRDRRHGLSLEARYYAKAQGAERGSMHFDAEYQKMFELGWHELWIRGRATILHGDIIFPDEVAVGSDYLRGPFNDDYVLEIGGIGAELRFSIARDLVKVSAFHDLAAFGRVNRATGEAPLQLANAFGVGLHVLLLDAFQFDTYFGVGFATGGRFDQGLVLRLRQAF